MIEIFFESENFFGRSKKNWSIFFRTRKNFRPNFFFDRKKTVDRKKFGRKKIRVRKFFGRPKKFLVEIFFESEIFLVGRKKLVDFLFGLENIFGRKKLIEKMLVENCVGRSKKFEKFEKFVNFEVSLTFFVVDHSWCAGAKRVSTVIPNSILLVDLRETNGEKCGPASRGVEFLSSSTPGGNLGPGATTNPHWRSGIIKF